MGDRLFDHSVSIVSLAKNDKNYAMTCAWAMQVDYDKVVLLIGEQSITGQNIARGDLIGISVVGIEDQEIATKIGDTHSDQVDKFKEYNLTNYNDVFCLDTALIKMKCEIIDILHLEGIETDHLVYARVLNHESIPNKQFLHMSNY